MDETRSDKTSAIDDWMIDLLEDDRVVDEPLELRVSDGIHWMYRAALIRKN
ncbi:MAG: hypothetical protein KGN02_00315 [bacterium]|nr:hypothetical protein [bacterium]